MHPSLADVGFGDLTRRAQLHRMRDAAGRALRDWGLDTSSVRVLSHDYNTTLRVDAPDGRRFALRISLNSPRNRAEVEAEALWINALDEDTTVVVPRVVPTLDGRLCSTVRVVGIDRDLPVMVFSWLTGRNLGAGATLQQIGELGRAMARLHQHAAQWNPPAGSAVRSLNRPFMDSPNRIEAIEPVATPVQQQVIREAYDEAAGRLATRLAGPTMLIHADLHPWNVRWSRHGLSVFDFNDFGYGVALQDLAIAAFYLRGDSRKEQQLLQGYESVQSLPGFTTAEFEAMLAARNLLMLVDVSSSLTAESTEFAQRYLATTVSRMQHYLASGTFRMQP